MFVPRKVYLDSDPVLRKQSQLVSLPLSKEDSETMEYMLEHLRVSQDEALAEEYHLRAGVGLAAPQIGVSKRMLAIRIVYEVEGKQEVVSYALVNPKIVAHSAKKAYIQAGEGCLSVAKDVPGYVVRRANVTVKAYDFFTKQEVVFKFRGYEALVVQHELDHLDGILYYDHINKQNPFAPVEGALVY